MLWLAVAGTAFGALCGLVFRLPAFVAIAAAATIAVIVSLHISEPEPLLLRALIIICSQQIGYGLGVVLRATIHKLIRRRPDQL